jgi:hemerythrin-like domain-containing protein
LEEQLLFPEFLVHAGPSPLVTGLIEEHRRISAIVETLRNAPGPALIAEFCSVLRSHIRREENEFFQQVQDRVPRAALDRIGEEIERRAVRVCL